MVWRAGAVRRRSPIYCMVHNHMNDLLKAVLAEPLLHFALIGTAVFLLFGGQDDRVATAPVSETVITLSSADLERLSAQFAASWNRPPRDEELDGLIEAFIREEVLYREAKALGLDEGDAVIRQRLALKLEFVADAAASVAVPDEPEIAEWYATRIDDFTPPPVVAFRQVMFESEDDAETALALLGSGRGAEVVSRSTMLPENVERATPTAVDGAFGPGFFEAVATLPIGEWAGPVASAFGVHLVQLASLERAEAPPLAAVRDQVLAAWRQAKAEEFRAAQYDALRARYEIRMPEDVE